MKKFRAAVWQYYKRFLPLFIVCIFFSRLLQGLGRGPLGFPFMTPFFFLFVLCTSNTFDRLFLQCICRAAHSKKPFGHFCLLHYSAQKQVFLSRTCFPTV